jgi:fibronectin-binding autotransporter adhesin
MRTNKNVMKKSILQVMADYASSLRQIVKAKKQEGKPKQTTIKDALVAFALILLSSQSFATTYYSRTNNGNWNANATWSTVAYGNATNTGTYPKAGDIANIGDGYTIHINASVGCATLNIGQGVSGTLDFLSAANYVLTISGNVTLNTGSTFRYNSAVNRTHNCLVGGDFTNYGLVDFYVAASQVVNLTFNGNGNSLVTGTGIWDLNQVTLSKTTTTANMMDVQGTSFESGIRTLSLVYGTYNHNNTGTFVIGPGVATFTVGQNVIVKVPRGIVNFVPAGTTVILQGSIYVNGGTVNVGNTTGTMGISTDQNGAFVPYLEVSSGTLNVAGGICFGGGSALEPFSFRMTGGTINLNTGTTGTTRSVFCVNDVANSSFIMSAGTIILQNPNSAGTATVDFAINGTNGTVTTTGGTVQFGNASTPTGKTFSFRPYANALYPNFVITGTAAAAVTLRPSQNATANFKLSSLYIDANKTFDIRSIAGTAGDTKQMTLMYWASGTNALYNLGTFVARQSTVTFNTSGAQAIGGTSTTSFYNLTINNSSGITLNRAANVTNYLSMVNGKLITTNTNILTCGATANASLGSASSFVDGPMVHTIASAASLTKTYPIGKTSVWRPVVTTIKHSNATSVTYRAEVFNSPASALPYTKPASISNVSAVRYTRFIRQAVGNFTNATIQMYYGTDDVVTDYASLQVVHDNGTTQWLNLNGTATANGTGNITSGTFTVFNNYFALANPPGGTNALPVTLSNFRAALSNRKVYVNWTTEAEVNCARFIVERSSDNHNYTAFQTVEGAGNSTSILNYSVIDNSPMLGVSYYRLKQVDYDGATVIYHPASIRNVMGGTFDVYPTVNKGDEIHLRYSDNDLSTYAITVTDAHGIIIPVQMNAAEGGLDISIDENYRRHGSIYFITAVNGEDVLRNKFIISEN